MHEILTRIYFKHGWGGNISYNPKQPFWRQDISHQWTTHRHMTVDQYNLWKRADLIDQASQHLGSFKALIETLRIRNIFSVGSGFGYYELLLQAENPGARVVASDTPSEYLARRQECLDEAPSHGFPQSIEFIHLDVLDQATYENVPFPDIDLMLFIGSTAPFLDHEIVRFLRLLAPRYIVVIAKTGEQYSVLKRLQFLALEWRRRVTGARLVLLGWIRSRKEYECLMREADYTLLDSAIYKKPTRVPFLRNTNAAYVFARSDQRPANVNASHLWRFQ